MVAGAGAEIAVVSFSDEPRFLCDFTRDHNRPIDAIRNLALMGPGNALIDALKFSCERFSGPGRRVIVVIGEARDRDSGAAYAAVREQILRAPCEVYFLTYSAYAMPFTGGPAYECPPKHPRCREEEKEAVAPEPPRSIFGELKRLRSVSVGAGLAADTGGEMLRFYSQNALDKAMQRIGRGIHEGYILSFAPAATAEDPKGFRSISVRMKNPAYVIAHRKQYFYD